MKKVILQFPSMASMHDFLDLTKIRSFDVNRKGLFVICEVSAAHLDLARKAYQAAILEYVN